MISWCSFASVNPIKNNEEKTQRDSQDKPILRVFNYFGLKLYRMSMLAYTDLRLGS